MTQASIAIRLAQAYRRTAAAYRQSDELEVTRSYHRHICATLRNLSGSFGRPITVLDAGCGAGRSFHCLNNTQLLVALDLCPEMLQQARHPVRAAEISIRQTQFLCGDIHAQTFPDETFELIYAIGVFGHGSGLSAELLAQSQRWLVSDGVLFFDAFDASALPACFTIRKKISNYFFRSPLLNRLRNALRKASPDALPFYCYSQAEIRRLLRSTGFINISVSTRECETPLGLGNKLQCLGYKSPVYKFS